MPDLKYLGEVRVGKVPDWLTFTPDSKKLYVANAHDNFVSVIDVAARKEIAQDQGGTGAEAEHHGDSARVAGHPVGRSRAVRDQKDEIRRFLRSPNSQISYDRSDEDQHVLFDLADLDRRRADAGHAEAIEAARRRAGEPLAVVP